MKRVTVKASRTYEVQIEYGLLKKAGSALASLLPPPRTVMIVSDDTVDALWGDTLTLSLESAGYTVKKFIFTHGEASKTQRQSWRFGMRLPKRDSPAPTALRHSAAAW